MPAAVTYTGLPEKLWLLGGGRHRATRDLRRAARFKRRAYYLAGMIIRPGRKVDVTPHFIADHLDEIIKHINEGTLLVQHRGDHFVDTDELRAIAAVVRGETPVGPVTKADASAGETPEPVTEPETTEPDDSEVDEDAETPVVPKPAMPITEPAPPDDAPPAVEEPQAFPDGFDPLADAPPVEEPTAPVVAAPVEVLEDDEPRDEVDEERRFLPEGWATSTKKELLALCKERGITADPKSSNQKLVEVLAAWLKGK